MQRSNMGKTILLIWLSIGLVACSNNERRAELQAYVNKIKSREIKEIEPLPEVKPYETFTYNDSNARSPFMPSTPIEVAKHNAVDNGIRPDTNRRKEPLEAFPLDSLRMMGTLEKNGKKWAIVVDTDGTVHRISKGNFVGQHDGRVDNITEEKVMITEIIPDGSGGWRERKASLALIDESDLQKKGMKK
ncbi:MAG: pilus assembly protein PilP [Proteobacteria bacterium]|nr:pilus assembly protein PilP [Pseudomonadota bacterium]